jgi:hypothetical protein
MWKRYNTTFDPSSNLPFKLSRSKVDLFIECPKCFYLDKRLGITRPSIPGFSLNSAVDALLKKEFDLLRAQKKSHALMDKYRIPAIPYSHREMDVWRENFKGKEFHDKETNLIISGAVDDVWQNDNGELHIVDYKSTSTDKVISLNDQYKQGYKRQMEIYQWIYRQSGFNISKTGYFVFANASKNKAKFDGKLEFELTIIAYDGDDSWIPGVLRNIKKTLLSDKIPAPSENCEHCRFAQKWMGKTTPKAVVEVKKEIKVVQQLSF